MGLARQQLLAPAAKSRVVVQCAVIRYLQIRRHTIHIYSLYAVIYDHIKNTHIFELQNNWRKNWSSMVCTRLEVGPARGTSV